MCVWILLYLITVSFKRGIKMNGESIWRLALAPKNTISHLNDGYFSPRLSWKYSAYL